MRNILTPFTCFKIHVGSLDNNKQGKSKNFIDNIYKTPKSIQ